jgi:hypothetical protein
MTGDGRLDDVTQSTDPLPAGIAARTLALPDAQSVEDLTALPTSAGDR